MTVERVFPCKTEGSYLLDRLLDVGVLLEKLLVKCGSRKSSRARVGAGICVTGARGWERDMLTLQHPWVSS